MELLVLAYIAVVLTWISFEMKKSKLESSLNSAEFIQTMKNIQEGINSMKEEIQDLNSRFKQRGF